LRIRRQTPFHERCKMPHPERRSPTVRRAIARAAVAALVFLIAASAWGQPADAPRIPAAEAAHHVGEIATVCGHVASAAHITSVKGAPTFLNLGRPYPDQHFTVVIWEAARARFERPPERTFDRKSICVTGRIETYKGRPQIVVEDPEQIWVEDPVGGGEDLIEMEKVLVKALLSQLGYETDYGTGEWNQAAVEAAIAFQEANGLRATGDPDPATLRALAGSVAEIPEADRTLVIRLLLFEIVRRME
jgi:hypothetical protein